jgi:peptidoglycan hydrolase CwlO-like protein
MADSKIAQMEKRIKELIAEKENAEKQIQKLRNHTEIGHSDPLFAYSQG